MLAIHLGTSPGIVARLSASRCRRRSRLLLQARLPLLQQASLRLVRLQDRLVPLVAHVIMDPQLLATQLAQGMEKGVRGAGRMQSIGSKRKGLM